MYLTGVSNASTKTAAAARTDLGILITPLVKSYGAHAAAYPGVAADNGCFSQGDRFDLDAYLGWLGDLEVRPDLLFAPAPDVVGDAVATLRRSAPVLPMIRALGVPAAYVIQDGQEHAPIPWADLDAIFIGGSTAFKLGSQARNITRAAKNRGKHVHMGRVNSYKRLAYAASIGCDTADGTMLRFGCDTHLPRLTDWLAIING